MRQPPRPRHGAPDRRSGSPTRAPTARTCTSFERAAAPATTTITASSPARAAYAALDAAVFPVDAQTRRVAPFSTALVTATLIPRSLNEPVGFAPSHLSQS